MESSVLRGVNLTGWLTLEPWVTPTPFAHARCVDEAQLIEVLGTSDYQSLVREHRSTFIQSSDFVSIASRGFNAVRISVPWYVFEEDSADTLYIGCIQELDNALDWAEELGLHVIFVLAVNPGLPDGLDNKPGGAPRTRISRDKSLTILHKLGLHYAHRCGFYGIEVADEVNPRIRKGLQVSDGIPGHLLRNYYRRAYETIREVAGEEPVVILPDGGWPQGFRRFMSQQAYKNVWLDAHLDRPSTQIDCSGPCGVQKIIDLHSQYVKKAASGGLPVMVGKWSASLPSVDGAMTAEGRIALERIYTSGQLKVYNTCPAWFFQTWKTSAFLAAWDARVALATFERRMLD